MEEYFDQSKHYTAENGSEIKFREKYNSLYEAVLRESTHEVENLEQNTASLSSINPLCLSLNPGNNIDKSLKLPTGIHKETMKSQSQDNQTESPILANILQDIKSCSNQSSEDGMEVSDNQFRSQDVPSYTKCANSIFDKARKQNIRNTTKKNSNPLILFDTLQKMKGIIKNSENKNVNFSNLQNNYIAQSRANTCSNFHAVPTIEQIDEEFNKLIASEECFNEKGDAGNLFHTLQMKYNSDNEDSNDAESESDDSGEETDEFERDYDGNGTYNEKQGPAGDGYGEDGNWHIADNEGHRRNSNKNMLDDNEHGNYDCYRPDNENLFKNGIEVNFIPDSRILKVSSKSSPSDDIECASAKSKIYNKQFAVKHENILQQNILNSFVLKQNNDSYPLLRLNKLSEGTCKRNIGFENNSHKNQPQKISSEVIIKNSDSCKNTETILDKLEHTIESFLAFCTTIFVITSIIVFVILNRIRQRLPF